LAEIHTYSSLVELPRRFASPDVALEGAGAFSQPASEANSEEPAIAPAVFSASLRETFFFIDMRFRSLFGNFPVRSFYSTIAFNSQPLSSVS
jgi:hypothetical protein